MLHYIALHYITLRCIFHCTVVQCIMLIRHYIVTLHACLHIQFHSIPWQLHCNYKTYLHSLAKNRHVSRATVSLDSKWTLDPFRRHSRHSEIRVSRNSALWDSYLPEEKIRKNHAQHIRFSFANGSRVDFRVCLKATVEAKIKKTGCTSPTPLVYVTFQPWPFPFLFERDWWLVLQPSSLAVLLLRFVLAKGPHATWIFHMEVPLPEGNCKSL